ncbi:MAG: hypothetical protein HYR72_17650 [Deltaproteobacteria bacterium]|nr:hypothetical protein [Deltaproteobacteria bacterium]MBI3386454.1 hypothetical protein [Deltaproteobacteria bacterium]
MDFVEMLQKVLSPTDFARMQAWMMGMEPARQMEMMQFITDRETRAPAIGDPAPDFELPRLGSDERVRLSTFHGDQPVALIFGSFT